MVKEIREFLFDELYEDKRVKCIICDTLCYPNIVGGEIDVSHITAINDGGSNERTNQHILVLHVIERWEINTC